MRLIDADALPRHGQRGGLVHWKDIEEAPSIDIVFCKECKKANTEDCSHSYWDDDWGEWRVSYRGDDWHCADGERERVMSERRNFEEIWSGGFDEQRD